MVNSSKSQSNDKGCSSGSEIEILTKDPTQELVLAFVALEAVIFLGWSGIVSCFRSGIFMILASF